MTLSTRAIDWNRHQRDRCGGRGNDRQHQWFPCYFRVSFLPLHAVTWSFYAFVIFVTN